MNKEEKLKRFLEIRTELEKSQRDMAQFIGRSKSCIQKWECGINEIPDLVINYIEYKLNRMRHDENN